MFKAITNRFFLLDNNCEYINRLREHEASVILYAELVDDFCAEQKIEYQSHSFRCDDRLKLIMTDQERERLHKEFGSRSMRPLWQLWSDFLKRKKAKNKIIAHPQLLRFLPQKMTNFHTQGFEYDGRVYVMADGDGIEESTFPAWCREITGSEFYRVFEASQVT